MKALKKVPLDKTLNQKYYVALRKGNPRQGPRLHALIPPMLWRSKERKKPGTPGGR